jgi:tetratricopeptide (TPR) repeat protein
MATPEGKFSRPCRMALLAAVVVLIAGAVAAQTPINDAQQQWQQLNAQGMEAYEAGDYAKGVASAEQALQLARQAFGPRHPQALTSLNNLAALYQAQGRYGEAEPLYKEALQGKRETLGPRHPNTLQSLNNLAALYAGAGPLQRGGAALQGGATGFPRDPWPAPSAHAPQPQQPGWSLPGWQAAPGGRTTCSTTAELARSASAGSCFSSPV